MKKVFIIYWIKDKDIHVPSQDYYARNNDSSTDTIDVLNQMQTFDTYEEAEQNLLNPPEDSEWQKGIYVILPAYIK